MRRPKNVLLRCAAVLAAGIGFTFAAAGLAAAAGPQPVAPTELSKATNAARSSEALNLLGKAGGTAKAAASVARDTQPIYALNPAFVRDASAPVATFWYAATTAAQGGRTLTVFTTPDAKGAWHAVNVASGNTEARMVSAAAGALVFTEPQLGAWYALSGTQVRPLNQPAIKSIGTKPISVTAYQELVSARYSDKLPGTHYNDVGMAGGYDPTTSATATAQVSPSNHLLLITTSAGVLALALLLLTRRHTLKTHYND
ncbi:hypothetical protein EV651_11735 [Kribbella sp. VKM Ac-2571]|uniref:hypothetical protein n=1 Tax=Kribbella sp. VKM Ac-2571 TaxID=2512222 RepID=UPI00105F9445|nr:hypothetical protein [Kribbella sp. VKM Ac-2571]TDO52845.1 hypothetical protein EV651_11735 [Kribbella sp. VKM Ac-2571]